MDGGLSRRRIKRATKRLAINSDNAVKHVMQARYPLCKAPLKRLYIQAGKQDAQLIMTGRSVLEGEKPTQQINLLLPVKRDRRPPIRAGNHRAQNKQKNFVQRVRDLGLLARVIDACEVLQKLGRAGLFL